MTVALYVLATSWSEEQTSSLQWPNVGLVGGAIEWSVGSYAFASHCSGPSARARRRMSLASRVDSQSVYSCCLAASTTDRQGQAGPPPQASEQHLYASTLHTIAARSAGSLGRGVESVVPPWGSASAVVRGMRFRTRSRRLGCGGRLAVQNASFPRTSAIDRHCVATFLPRPSQGMQSGRMASARLERRTSAFFIAGRVDRRWLACWLSQGSMHLSLLVAWSSSPAIRGVGKASLKNEDRGLYTTGIAQAP